MEFAAMAAEHRPDGGRLTTHILDTASGRPGSDIAVTLYAVEGDARRELARTRTNADGRCEKPLLAGADFRPGLYELVFATAEYFRARGMALAEPPFLDEIRIRFGIAAADQHYHVPLLVSPYAYSTYRGS
jgi:5-hydroxyisourate hydrolase